jgi:hypothetical protein
VVLAVILAVIVAVILAVIPAVILALVLDLALCFGPAAVNADGLRTSNPLKSRLINPLIRCSGYRIKDIHWGRQEGRASSTSD